MHRPDFPGVFSMWLLMTAVMMAPVVFPWLRALRRFQGAPSGGAVARDGSALMVPAFGAGYAVAWIAFSAVAAGVQIALARVGAHAPLAVTAPRWAGGALILTGAFQLTSLKDACLTHCRSPFGYFAASWRPGAHGAWAMGLRHGVFCLGCCWALMALALVVGTMALVTMAVLMALMVLEAVAPFGRRLTRPVGLLLAAWGVALVLFGGM